MDSSPKGFSAKHAPDVQIDARLETEVTAKAVDGQIPCAMCFDIAARLGLPPSAVGTAADLLEIRLSRCQLGLFGYHPEKKRIKPAKQVDPKMRATIQAALDDGKLSCAAVFAMAANLEVSKTAVAAVCEALGVKIKPCQLGAF